MRLNNKGQSLIMFILIMPVILIIGVIVIDMGNAYAQKEKLNSLNKMVIKNYLDDKVNEDEAIELINKNDKNIDAIVDAEEGEIIITLSKKIDSFLGKIIGKKDTLVVSSYQGKLINNKKEIKKAE